MTEMLHGLDKVIVFRIAGTAGLLLFGTLLYFRSCEKVSPGEMTQQKDKGKSTGKSASSASSSSDEMKGFNGHTSRTVRSSSASVESASCSTSEMRGYKITSDGRKTTYFNREITEEEKILLGDSTPKPLIKSTLSTASICSQSSSLKSASCTGSAWNTAGTWEERNHSPWALKRIKQLFTTASLDITNRNETGTIKVTKINSIEGDAMITMIRGKKKFIYDYTISLDWTLLIGLATITGSVMISDVNAECDYEVNYELVSDFIALYFLLIFVVAIIIKYPSAVPAQLRTIACLHILFSCLKNYPDFYLTYLILFVYFQFDITTTSGSVSPVSRELIQKYVRSKSEGMQLLMRQKLDRFFLDFKMLEQ